MGSTNPKKIQAVKNALEGEQVFILPCSVDSQVGAQPLSDKETLQGALARANHSLQLAEADIGLGLEAGIVFLDEKIYLSHWGVLVDRSQNVYQTNAPLILLPSSYRDALLAGESLENIIHRAEGIESLGKKQGAVGLFTQNLVTREQMLTQMVQVLVGQHRFYTSALSRL